MQDKMKEEIMAKGSVEDFCIEKYGKGLQEILEGGNKTLKEILTEYSGGPIHLVQVNLDDEKGEEG